MKLTGKRIVIAGGSGFLGLSMAEGFEFRFPELEPALRDLHDRKN